MPQQTLQYYGLDIQWWNVASVLSDSQWLQLHQGGNAHSKRSQSLQKHQDNDDHSHQTSTASCHRLHSAVVKQI